ncbi:MAG: monofunctional biosynthetic peptidoglycan transglycosylase [Nitrospina sp.]|nr:MAG: monofunctional biosynthetic peptidoglycan transglycosylase [Nitrospina sp.]
MRLGIWRWQRKLKRASFWGRVFKVTVLLSLIFLFVTFLPVLIYKVIDPPTTPLMWIRWAESGYEKRYPRTVKKWRKLDRISKPFLRAVIASEDQKFYRHNGFDWDAVNNAIRVNLSTRRKIGASTISMQTARNVFLWQKRNWLRKSLEIYFTVLIEMTWSKQRILEVYMNVIEWGDGVFGCEAAAQKYFKHSAGRVQPAEGAWMAAILPNPRAWPTPAYRSHVGQRQTRILNAMTSVRLYAVSP